MVSNNSRVFVDVCVLSFWGCISLISVCFPLIVIDAIDNHYGMADYWVFIENYDIDSFDVLAIIGFIFANFLTSYGAVKRWERKGVETVFYKESIFWMIFTTFLFCSIGMIWVIQKFISEKIAILFFLANVYALIVSALMIATIMYLLVSKRQGRNL